MVCVNGHEFDGPMLSDMSDGEFLAQSEGGTFAYVNSWTDPVWDEVEGLLDDLVPNHRSLGTGEVATLTQTAYAATMDAAPDGAYRIGKTICPTCRSLVKSIHVEEPYRSLADIPTISHNAWARLDPSAKRQMVDQSIRLGSHVTFSDADLA